MVNQIKKLVLKGFQLLIVSSLFLVQNIVCHSCCCVLRTAIVSVFQLWTKTNLPLTFGYKVFKRLETWAKSKYINGWLTSWSKILLRIWAVGYLTPTAMLQIGHHKMEGFSWSFVWSWFRFLIILFVIFKRTN